MMSLIPQIDIDPTRPIKTAFHILWLSCFQNIAVVATAQGVGPFGAGTISAEAVTASTLTQSSQRSNASGGMITGMRPWMSATARLALVVTIAAVSISSPSGPVHVSHRPAKASGAPDPARTKYGTLRPATDFHS